MTIAVGIGVYALCTKLNQALLILKIGLKHKKIYFGLTHLYRTLISPSPYTHTHNTHNYQLQKTYQIF